MNYCAQCGNPMGDQDKFCNKCGGRGGVMPLYQNPVAPQPGFAPVSVKPYKPPFWVIGLFILLGSFVVELVRSIVNTVMMAMGFMGVSSLASILLSGFYVVIPVLITCIGFVIYNSACKRNHHPEKKLSIFWVAVPLLLREILRFIFGFLWGLLLPFLVYNSGIDAELIGIVSLGVDFVMDLITALLTWLLTILILKAVVKGK